MGIVGSEDIENVGEIGGVADEFQDSGEFFLLKAIDIVDCDDDGAVDLLEGGLDAVVGFFEGTELETLCEDGERNFGPPRSQLGGLAEQEEHVAVDIIVEAVVFEFFAEKGEELLDDGLFVFAKPRAVVDVVIGLWALRKLLFEDFEEGEDF